jgi:hypothetical protein
MRSGARSPLILRLRASAGEARTGEVLRGFPLADEEEAVFFGAFVPGLETGMNASLIGVVPIQERSRAGTSFDFNRVMACLSKLTNSSAPNQLPS